MFHYEMFSHLLLHVTVLIGAATCGVISEDREQDLTLKYLCNQTIPDDQSVETGKECKITKNCQEDGAECVYVRDNYCQCQVPEERMEDQEVMTQEARCIHVHKKKKHCFGAPPCEKGKYCDRKSKKCECNPPTILVDGVCVTPPQCSEYAGGHSIRIFTEKLNYEDAVAACEANGMRLVVIKDEDMTTAIKEAVVAQGVSDQEWLWIGLEFVSRSNFKWLDDSTLTLRLDGTDANGGYTNWANGRSSFDAANNEECFILFPPDKKWEDLSCERSVMYVCECQ